MAGPKAQPACAAAKRPKGFALRSMSDSHRRKIRQKLMFWGFLAEPWGSAKPIDFGATVL